MGDERSEADVSGRASSAAGVGGWLVGLVPLPYNNRGTSLNMRQNRVIRWCLLMALC